MRLDHSSPFLPLLVVGLRVTTRRVLQVMRQARRETALRACVVAQITLTVIVPTRHSFQHHDTVGSDGASAAWHPKGGELLIDQRRSFSWYENSDTPFSLAAAVLETIPVLAGTENTGFDWTIFTGDLVSHDPENQLSR